MNFNVTITTDELGSLIDNVNFGIGLDIFKQAQKKISNLVDYDMLHIASCRINAYQSKMSIEITEKDIIDKIPCFEAKDIAKVIVPAGILGRYTKITFNEVVEKTDDYENRGLINSIKFLYRSITKNLKLKEVWVNRDIDTDTIIDDWVADGCPTYWNVDKVAYDEKIKRRKIAADKEKEAQRIIAEKEEKRIKEEKRMSIREIQQDIATLANRLNDYLG